MIGDPLRTTLVLLAIIAVLAGAGRCLSSDPESTVRAVEYEPTLAAAREAASYPVLGPAELPAGWRANSVRYRSASEVWHLGILTDEDLYIGIEQAPTSVEEMVEEFAAEAAPEGTREVGGDTWDLLREGDRTTLVREDADAITLVTGDAPQATIEEFVAELTESG